MSAAERFAARLWEWRRLLFALCLVLTAAALWQASKVGVDNSLRIWFLDDDPHLVAYRKYQARFGNDEVVVVALSRAGGMAAGGGLQLLGRAETLLGAVPGVQGVMSIASPGDPALARHLISGDGKTAALVVRMQPGEDFDARRDAVLRDIDNALAALGEPHHLAGIGVLYVALNRLSMVDASILFCGAVALMFVLLWLVYRRAAPALATLGIAGAGMLWTLGLYGACGRSLNMVTSAMPTVVLVVGVAEMVHILLHAAGLPQSAGRREKVVAVISRMLRPCLLNGFTSAAGFAALAASPLPAVRDLGLFTAAGLFGCMLLTLVGATFALGAPRFEPRPGARRSLRRCTERLAGLGMRHPALTLAIGAALATAAAAAASRLVVDTYTLEFLAGEHRVRRDSELIEARLGPYVPMDFLVRAPGGAVRPALIEALQRWQRAGEQLPGIGWSRSLADDPWQAGAHLDPRLADDGTLRVTFSVRMQSAKGIERTMRGLLAAARLPRGTTVEPAGYLPLYVRMIDYIVDSQIRGFALAFLAVFGIIAAAFRSWTMAALALPSNLLPLLVILGAMGAAGIRLDAATATIATVVLGLVVDDTVHFLHRLREGLEDGADPADAVRATVRSSGHALMSTALVMTLGFSVFALSEIRSLVYFGLLIALAMATSVVTDLLIVPALVMLRRRKEGVRALRRA